tara:strand:- start:68 stop:409 length:342 start_codon:yes stop_codon:yes gene_type:complete
MKNFLIALAIFILASCSDPRAKDKEMLVALELQYGDISSFEAECFINIWSDAIDDDDVWDWLVAESTQPSLDTSVSAKPTKYEIEVGIVVAASLPQIRDECGFDFEEVYYSRY